MLAYTYKFEAMSKDINETTKRVARLNDIFRASILKPVSEQCLGKIFCTASIMALPEEDINHIAEKVSLFDNFNEGNDPYGEHDFGSFIFNDDKVYWRIDYEDPSLEYQPKDKSEPNEPNRILTIMFSYEW